MNSSRSGPKSLFLIHTLAQIGVLTHDIRSRCTIYLLSLWSDEIIADPQSSDYDALELCVGMSVALFMIVNYIDNLRIQYLSTLTAWGQYLDVRIRR